MEKGVQDSIKNLAFFFLQRLFRKLRRKSKRQSNSADIAR
jgi:hypothetical protein